MRLLCAATTEPGMGGISCVSRTISRVLRDQYEGDFEELNLLAAGREIPTFLDKLRFVGRLARLEFRRRARWVFFDHVGLAGAERVLPGRRPYGIFLHGVEVWGELPARRLAILRGACLLVANTHHTASRVMERHPELSGIAVCHPCLLPEGSGSRDGGGTLSAHEEQLLGGIGESAVLIVGRLAAGEAHKGHDQLLEAWPEVKKKAPPAQLVVVGDGPQASRLKSKAAAIGISDSVLFTGRVSEALLDALYLRAALFALPSRGEGFGMVHLEAMRRGLPCIGSIEDGSREIIVDGETGYLIRQDDAHALVDRITGLLSDRTRAAALGAAGRRREEEVFSYRHFYDRFLSLVQDRLETDREVGVGVVSSGAGS